jgi:membrane protein implicated in regulation of membrane protease activity
LYTINQSDIHLVIVLVLLVQQMFHKRKSQQRSSVAKQKTSNIKMATVEKKVAPADQEEETLVDYEDAEVPAAGTAEAKGDKKEVKKYDNHSFILHLSSH